MATILDEERKKTQTGAPAPTAPTARPSNFMPDTNAVMDGVGQNLGEQLRQGRVGAAVGEAARGAAAMVPALVNDVVLRPLAPVGRAMVDAVSTFAGGDAGATAPAPVAQPAPPRLGVGAQGSTGDARRQANDFERTKAPAPQPTAPQPDPLNGFKETSVGGVYRRGNAFSDAAGLNDNALWNRGTVSPQNNAAASALSMGSAAQPTTVTVEAPTTPTPAGAAPSAQAAPAPVPSAVSVPAAASPAATASPVQGATPSFGATPSGPVAGASPPLGLGANQQALARLQASNATSAPGLGVQMPTLRHSGNDWQARTDLRNARLSANSLSNDGRWGGRGGKSPDVLAYEAALATDEAAKQGRNPLAQEVVQQQGLGVRAQMQEQGATQRAQLQEVGLGARARMANEIQQGELGIKQGEFGARKRSTDRLEGLRDEYTKANPQRQAEIARQIREISGTATPEAWKGVELSGGMDSQGYRLPSQLGVVNSATGEVRMPGQGVRPPIDQNQQAMAIRNNPNLSRQQKVEELRKLGYS
jgi:hypothetical protein